MEDFEFTNMVNDHHHASNNYYNFGRKVDAPKQVRKVAPEHKEKYDSKKIIAATLAGVVATVGVIATAIMHKDWKNNTNYCNLTNKEATTFSDYVTIGPKTETIYVELEGEKYMFSDMEEGLQLYNAAVLNEHETAGIDKKEDFIKDNYENYLVYVGEQLQFGNEISAEDYIDYKLEELSKGAR